MLATSSEYFGARRLLSRPQHGRVIRECDGLTDVVALHGSLGRFAGAAGTETAGQVTPELCHHGPMACSLGQKEFGKA